MKVKCDWCGKITSKNSWRIERNKHNFCSRECFNNFMRKRREVKCDYCGADLQRKPSKVDRNMHNFCNITCHAKWTSELLNGSSEEATELRAKISKTWFKLGQLAHNRIQFNEDVFWNLTQESAYLLGLIASDGCVDDVEFRIALCDLELIEKVRNSLFPNHSIIEVQFKKYNSNRKNQYILRVGSKRVARRLLDLRIKSQIPPIPDDLFSHYVRGFFDGDGTLGVYKSALTVRFYGSKEFLGKLESEIRKRLGFNQRTVVRGNGGWSVGYGGSFLPLKLCKWIYANAHIYLGRKHKIFIDYFDNWSNKRKGRQWTEDEIRLLKEKYPHISTRELSKEFGRTYQSIRTEASILNIRKEV